MQRMYVIDLLPSKVGINIVFVLLLDLGIHYQCCWTWAYTICPTHLFLVDSREIAWSYDSDDCELAGSQDSNG